MTTQEFKNKIKKELQETEELFQMGCLTPKERFSIDYQTKQDLNRFYKLTQTGKYRKL